MSRILDFYGVRWEYEPDTFPILWNTEGDVIESFSPDFYLPDVELYVELTTLKQKLVRKKNRKLRRLRELYPGIQIKLFYARDFRMLLLKFGRLALHDELSGSTGQSTPRRPVLESLAAPAAAAAAATDDAEPRAGDLLVPVPDHEPGAREGRGRRRGKRRRRPATADATGVTPEIGPDPGAQPA